MRGLLLCLSVPVVCLADTVNLIVMGMSGQGKSTFLNALADDGEEYIEHYPVGAGQTSVTKTISTKHFHFKTDSVSFDLALTDTMGFPDPDPKKAQQYYDAVIAECNKPQNAIVWVHKAERKNHKVVEQLKVLLRQFNHAAPPVYIIVNGQENYQPPKYRTQAQIDKAKVEHRQKHVEIGQELAKAAGISAKAIIAGADMGDLVGLCKEHLGLLLTGTQPQSSNLKTVAQLQNEMAAAKTDSDRAEVEKKEAQAAERKAKSNKDSAEAERHRLATAAAITGASAAGLAFIPFAGPALAAAAAATAAGLGAAAEAKGAEIPALIKLATDAAAKAAEQVINANRKSAMHASLADQFNSYRQQLGLGN